MKKKIFLILFTIIVCLTLAGCGNNEDNKKEDNKQQINDNNSDKLNDNDNKEETQIKLYSDNTKIVYNFNNVYKLVYYYKGNTITGMEYYYNYETKEAAKYALTTFKAIYNNNEEDGIKEIKQNGTYVIIVFDKSEYENLTVEEIKETYSYLEQIYNNN